LKVVSWHPVLTDHQSYTLAALQQAGDGVLKVYVAKMVHAERQAQGWVNPHASSLSPELIPNKGWFKFALQMLREHRDAVHLFGSPFEQTKLIVVLLLAVALGLRVFLISESYSSKPVGYLNDKRQYINWFKAKLRPLIYGIYGALLRRRIGGVFAISCRAVEQYQSIGIARNKIFPFGYFVPCQKPACSLNAPTANPQKQNLKVVFIGNLIATKGLDILINAVRAQNNSGMSLSLDVYGPGDSKQYNFDQTKIRYCGVIPFGNAQAVISEYDVLVLPSRYDGWGVVVNEALMAGVPVICSNQVGAGAVVAKWQCGAIFASEDESDLAIKLKELLLNPMLLNNMRLAASKAGASLDPRVAGQYMFDIISQDSVATGMLNKPECPWYDCHKSVESPAHG
jgi:glycosyltransferase involved in cell wall biosynthesis